MMSKFLEQETLFDDALQKLINEHAEFRRRIIALEKRNGILETRLGYAITKADDEVTFDEIENAACAALGITVKGGRRKSGWQTAFEQQSGYEHHTVETWKKSGKAPAHAINEAKVLQPVERSPAVRWKQRPELMVTLEHLYVQKRMTYEDIAVDMQQRFPDLCFNVNMISGQIRVQGLTGKGRRSDG